MADYSAKKITDLTEKTAPSDSDLFVAGNNGTATMRKMSFANIVSGIIGKLTGAVSSILTSNLIASRALISNSSGKVAASGVSSTELGYLSGASSNIQSQLSALNSNSVSCQTTTATDFNNFPNNSWVWANNTSNTYTNAPATSAFHVMTIKNGDYYKAQIAIAYSNSGVYVRTSTGASWTIWKTFSFV